MAAVYVDLTYLPSGSASSTVDQHLFRCLRSSYYIISGDDPLKATTMRSILDSLLEGKSTWPEVPVGGAGLQVFLFFSSFPLIGPFPLRPPR